MQSRHIMQHTKSLFFFLIFASVITLPASAQRTKKISETIPLNAEGRVLIDTYKGSIEVTTWDREEVSVEAVVEADENRELVELTDVNIKKTGNTLHIESDYRRAKNKGGKWRLFGNNKGLSLPFVHYVIRMPRTTELNIEDYKSEIDIEDLTADLELETYKGNVRVEDIQGELQIDTYKGDVEVMGLAGGLEAETYKGNIEVEFVELTGHTSIDTYRGEIRLHLPENAGFDLNADLGRSGDLDTNFRLDNVRVEDNRYRGQIGGGGPKLEVDTYKGRVKLETR